MTLHLLQNLSSMQRRLVDILKWKKNVIPEKLEYKCSPDETEGKDGSRVGNALRGAAMCDMVVCFSK